MDDWEIYVRVAVAAATEAQRRGLARVALGIDDIETRARTLMQSARDSTDVLMRAGLIPAPDPVGRHGGAS